VKPITRLARIDTGLEAIGIDNAVDRVYKALWGSVSWIFKIVSLAMLPTMRSAAVALLVSAAPTLAQFPAEPVGLKVLESRFGDGVKITFKEVCTA
jgi:hypothetical protein